MGKIPRQQIKKKEKKFHTHSDSCHLIVSATQSLYLTGTFKPVETKKINKINIMNKAEGSNLLQNASLKRRPGFQSVAISLRH